MNPRHLCLAALAPVLLAGCASDWSRSYARWRGYEEGSGPYSSWARCIRDRSFHYHDPNGTGVVVTGAADFVQVLTDCRPHMTGSVWNSLSTRQVRRMVDDAYQAFLGAGAELMAQQEASVI